MTTGLRIDKHDTYAELSCGGITAEVVRFSYWDASDGSPDVEMVSINGLDNDAGFCDVYAQDAETLHALAAVCAQAALLLDEVRQTYRTEVPASPPRRLMCRSLSEHVPMIGRTTGRRPTGSWPGPASPNIRHESETGPVAAR
ncbi:MAG: hypothetical protein QOH60_2003 [Mycobacterium sp.]|jgi:hypothetical protein|nr:hypothetical protein [Mycobacterium sp.]